MKMLKIIKNYYYLFYSFDNSKIINILTYKYLIIFII